MPLLEHGFRIPFVNNLPSGKYSFRCYLNRVLPKGCCDGGSVTPVECLVKLHKQRNNLLHLWICRVLHRFLPIFLGWFVV
jgi:hypothetical protein